MKEAQRNDIHQRFERDKLEEIQKFLASNDEDPFWEDSHGNNLVHTAAQYGRCDILKYFWENHKELFYKTNSDRLFPVNFAIYFGHTKAIKFLVRRHISVLPEDSTTKSVKFDDKASFESITQGRVPSTLSYSREVFISPLPIKPDVSADIKDLVISLWKSQKELLNVAKEGKIEQLRKFKNENFNFDIIVVDEGNLLDIAVSNDRLSVVKYLIEECELNIDGKHPITDDYNIKKPSPPLLSAIELGHKNIAEYLFTQCGDNVSDHKNEALHHAVQHNKLEIVKFVVGCDENIVFRKDNSGKTALDSALTYPEDRKEIIKFLQKQQVIHLERFKIADGYSYKSLQPGFSWPKSLDEYIPSFAIITGVNGSGKTHLLEAIYEGLKRKGEIEYPKKAEEIEIKLSSAQDKIRDGFYLISYDWSPKKIREYSPQTIHQQADALIAEIREAKKNLKKRLVATTRMMGGIDIKEELDSSSIQGTFDRRVNDMYTFLHNRTKSGSAEVKTTDKSAIYDFLLSKTKEELHSAYENTILDYLDNITEYIESLSTIFGLYNKLLNEAQNKLLDDPQNDQATAHSIKEKARTIVLSDKKQVSLPWELLNQILERNGVNHRVTYPKVSNNILFKCQFQQIDPVSGNKIGSPKDFESMSSGEKRILSTLLWVFALKFTHAKIVLLDEPDASLHADWCKSFTQIIQKELVDSGVQVIMISHRAVTVSYAPEKSIFLMQKVGNDISINRTKRRKAIASLSSDRIMVLQDCQNRVYVEDQSDVEIYKTFWDFIKQENPDIRNDISLKFYPPTFNADQTGGCAKVVAMLESLVQIHDDNVSSVVADFVYGLIDLDYRDDVDNKQKYFDFYNDGHLSILERYSIENYLCDPVFYTINALKKGSALALDIITESYSKFGKDIEFSNKGNFPITMDSFLDVEEISASLEKKQVKTGKQYIEQTIKDAFETEKARNEFLAKLAIEFEKTLEGTVEEKLVKSFDSLVKKDPSCSSISKNNAYEKLNKIITNFLSDDKSEQLLKNVRDKISAKKKGTFDRQCDIFRQNKPKAENTREFKYILNLIIQELKGQWSTKNKSTGNVNHIINTINNLFDKINNKDFLDFFIKVFNEKFRETFYNLLKNKELIQGCNSKQKEIIDNMQKYVDNPGEFKVLFTNGIELSYPSFIKEFRGHDLEWIFGELFLPSVYQLHKVSDPKIKKAFLVVNNQHFHQTFLMPVELKEVLCSLQDSLEERKEKAKKESLDKPKANTVKNKPSDNKINILAQKGVDLLTKVTSKKFELKNYKDEKGCDHFDAVCEIESPVKDIAVYTKNFAETSKLPFTSLENEQGRFIVLKNIGDQEMIRTLEGRPKDLNKSLGTSSPKT